MKKILKYFLWVTVALAAVLALFLHFAPVSFDASACAGGYKTWVVDKYSEKFVSMFLTEQRLEQNTNIDVNSKTEIKEKTVNWADRKIYVTLKFSVDSKIYTVDYIGERYWIEKYKWSISNISIMGRS